MQRKLYSKKSICQKISVIVYCHLPFCLNCVNLFRSYSSALTNFQFRRIRVTAKLILRKTVRHIVLYRLNCFHSTQTATLQVSKHLNCDFVLGQPKFKGSLTLFWLLWKYSYFKINILNMKSSTLDTFCDITIKLLLKISYSCTHH